MTLDMVLEYPKVLDHTRYVIKETGEQVSKEDYESGDYEGDVEVDTSLIGKPSDLDRGDAKSDQKWLRELAKNPEAKVNCYFTSEEQIAYLMEYEGFEPMVTNPKTGEEMSRIKDGNEDFGIGKYIQLKRKLNDIREYRDKKGEIKEMDKGGVPGVKVFKDDAVVDYDYEELGPIGNGTESKVRFEPRYMRLEALGITNLVEFSDTPFEEDDF